MGTGRVISNFALQHLKTAILMHFQVSKLEAENLNQEFGAFFEDIRSYTSASIFASAAALEALINELFIGPSEKLRPLFKDFEKEFWGEDGVGKKGVEGMSILFKFNHGTPERARSF